VFTLEKFIFVIFTYEELQSVACVQRALRPKIHPKCNHKVPSYSVFQRLIRRLKSGGCIQPEAEVSSQKSEEPLCLCRRHHFDQPTKTKLKYLTILHLMKYMLIFFLETQMLIPLHSAFVCSFITLSSIRHNLLYIYFLPS